MKKILIMIAIATIAYCNADAQAKKTVKEKCSVSADKKTVTCCKTAPNPAYNANVAAKKQPAAKKAHVTTATTHVHQVCKDEGGYYTCCTHKKVTKTTKTEKQITAKAE